MILKLNESSGDCEDSQNEKVTKFLIFSLGDDSFGLPLFFIKEVIGLSDITKVPNSPNYFKGLINLRGKIISVVDLKIKLGIKGTEEVKKETSIIIVEQEGYTLGMVVDSVDAVKSFQAGQIERNLDLSSRGKRDYINGVAKEEGEHLTLLLDSNSIFDLEELKVIKESLKYAT